MKAFIIHGSMGSPEGHWLPWLNEQLKDFEVIAPQFPIDENQFLDNWLKVLEPYNLNDSVIVGHSLGVPFILNLLNGNVHFKLVVLVAGFYGPLEADGEPNLSDFSDKEFNWEKMKLNADNIIVFSSDNDPYIPTQLQESMAKKLGAEFILIKGARHFTTNSGYKEFPRLLEEINRSISP